ncbi:MAG: type 1 glutamine amidotransferase domain-containing protein [Burkholderiaceae bacterium]|jgi:protease I
MPQKPLAGRKIAILVMDNFEQAELEGPRHGLEEAGAQTLLISLKNGQVTGMNHDEKADHFKVDRRLDEVNADEFDAVVLPGGVFNSDRLRTEDAARAFVKNIQAQGKVIAAICHAPWLLASSGLLKGRRLTSWPSLQDDLRNAGATWVDEEVVVDGNLITSRKPDDIPAFNRKIIDSLSIT